MKHRYSIVAALLAALLVALLSGGALAEDRIELGVDGPEVAIEEIPAGDDLELDFGEDMAQDDLSLELPKDGLALDDALILSEALLTDDNPVEPEQNAIAPNEGEDIPIDEAHFPDENFTKHCWNVRYNKRRRAVRRRALGSDVFFLIWKQFHKSEGFGVLSGTENFVVYGLWANQPRCQRSNGTGEFVLCQQSVDKPESMSLSYE